VRALPAPLGPLDVADRVGADEVGVEVLRAREDRRPVLADLLAARERPVGMGGLLARVVVVEAGDECVDVVCVDGLGDFLGDRDEFLLCPRSLRQIQSQEGIVSTTKTSIAKVGVVIIPVADEDRAIEFYVDKLGFEKRADVPFGGDYRWVEVAPPGAETTIAIVRPPEGKPTGNVETGIAFHTEDINGVHTDLKASGVDVDDEVSVMGDPVPPMFWLRDQDGNTLMVVGV
jgi:catechol 2,3-dioxygenase-like lactoylglutathione lyase family enzyme